MSLTKYIAFSFVNSNTENGLLAHHDFCHSSASVSFTTEKQCVNRKYLNIHFKSDLEGSTAGFSGYFTTIQKGNFFEKKNCHEFYRKLNLDICNKGFYKIFGGHLPFLGGGGVDTLVLDWVLHWVSKPEWIFRLHTFLHARFLNLIFHDTHFCQII